MISKIFLAILLVFFITNNYTATANYPFTTKHITAEEATALLKEGNKRFYELKSINTNYDEQIEKTKDEQHPFAAILSCMDSRVPPEIVFDQGIGNIFVVREAGNVVSPNTLGSLEYAVNVKKVSLLIVLGHSGCGAVAAAVDGIELAIYKHLKPLVDQIKHAISTDGECPDHNVYKCTEKNNVKLSIAEILSKSTTISKAAEDKEVKIIGVYYDISTGIVTFVE
jgi:carbonic anhydrase